MNIIKTIIENKSGYEKKQERLKIIESKINEIKLSDSGADIDEIVSELINNDTHIDFQGLSLNNEVKSKSKVLIKNNYISHY